METQTLFFCSRPVFSPIYWGFRDFFFNLILLFHILALIAHTVLYLGTVGRSILLS